jgi:hypothetical protein
MKADGQTARGPIGLSKARLSVAMRSRKIIVV